MQFGLLWHGLIFHLVFGRAGPMAGNNPDGYAVLLGHAWWLAICTACYRIGAKKRSLILAEQVFRDQLQRRLSLEKENDKVKENPSK